LTEFIEGAARLRGNAKAIDIWRMETKLEVLFEEVLNRLKANTGAAGEGSADISITGSNGLPEHAENSYSSVEEAFHNSAYQHIKTTSKSRPFNSNPDSHVTPTRSGSPTGQKHLRVFEAQ
ncbi:SCN11A, partial [Symbiodinium pilosum]